MKQANIASYSELLPCPVCGQKAIISQYNEPATGIGGGVEYAVCCSAHPSHAWCGTFIAFTDHGEDDSRGRKTWNEYAKNYQK